MSFDDIAPMLTTAFAVGSSARRRPHTGGVDVTNGHRQSVRFILLGQLRQTEDGFDHLFAAREVLRDGLQIRGQRFEVGEDLVELLVVGIQRDESGFPVSASQRRRLIPKAPG